MVFLSQGSPTPLHRGFIESSLALSSAGVWHFSPLSTVLPYTLVGAFHFISKVFFKRSKSGRSFTRWNLNSMKLFILTLIYYSNLIVWNIDYVKLFTIKIFLVSNETFVQRNCSLSPSWSIDLVKFTIYYYYSPI